MRTPRRDKTARCIATVAAEGTDTGAMLAASLARMPTEKELSDWTDLCGALSDALTTQDSPSPNELAMAFQLQRLMLWLTQCLTLRMTQAEAH